MGLSDGVLGNLRGQVYDDEELEPQNVTWRSREEGLDEQRGPKQWPKGTQEHPIEQQLTTARE